MASWRWMKPVRRTPEEEQADKETMDWFDRVSDDDLAAYAGKVLVQYRGKIMGVGRSLDVALRRADLPKGAIPFIYWVPRPDEDLLL